ncbi:MAG: LysR family transcriptional regulator [Gammaproteobacteria bacterium]|nr:LysR family transcriptional regulator [Gammaproteobacteria bacterium]
MSTLRRLMPILNALLVFDEAGRQNSFTLAGRNLGMAQPSVSRFIANLENHLGSALFERQHNRLRLTARGERLHRAVASGLEEIRTACAEVESSSEPPLLTIECTHGFAYMWLLPRMQSLMKLLPGWRLRTINTDGGSPISSDEADLVVRIGDGQWVDRKSLLLFEEEVFPLCAADFMQQHGLMHKQVSPIELIELPLICEDFGDRGWMGWIDWFAHFGVNFEFPDDLRPLYNYALVLQAAMEGRGLALAWEQLAEPHLSNGWLTEVPGLRVKTNLGYYLCFSPTNPIGELLTRWLETMSAEVDY